ncbi:hypothetical protein WMY93_017700 [Mugilogobius chulae]|uniref:Tyrosine-protein kinase n=1 Tax=Mugilogobius chulae TaxID=88201 RepID=A0AAW0NQ27_9GOBI
MQNQYVALYDYVGRTPEDLTVRAGDKLQVLNKNRVGWWFARALTGISADERGYIPANHVAPVDSIEAEPWYFPDTQRADAEKMLLAEGNSQGTFLIRQCGSDKGHFALSGKLQPPLSTQPVGHFSKLAGSWESQTLQTDPTEWCVQCLTKEFKTVKDLVEEYHSVVAGGFPVLLGKPCAKLGAPATHGLSYNTVDQWEIPRNSITQGRKLGEGNFGEVYEGLWNGISRVAVKSLRPGSMEIKDMVREAQLMKRLHHDKLIQLYAVCTMEEPVLIVTEFMKHGSLLDYLKKDMGKSLSLSDQINMATQVASGMAYLEEQNYIHRDLAARNVLVGENNTCKVADFGLARVFKNENEVYAARPGCLFPVKWTALEGLMYNEFSIKSDVWSFGILLYEIITFGLEPYPGIHNFKMMELLLQGYRMPRPPNCPSICIES